MDGTADLKIAAGLHNARVETEALCRVGAADTECASNRIEGLGGWVGGWGALVRIQLARSPHAKAKVSRYSCRHFVLWPFENVFGLTCHKLSLGSFGVRPGGAWVSAPTSQCKAPSRVEFESPTPTKGCF